MTIRCVIVSKGEKNMRERSVFFFRKIRLSILSGMVLLLALGLSACGEDKGETEIDYYTVCGSTNLVMSGNNPKFEDGYLYYTYDNVLKRIPVDDALFSGEEVPEEVLADAGLLKSKEQIYHTASGSGFSYAMDREGNLYTLEITKRLNAQFIPEVTGMKLVGTAADGSSRYEVDLSDKKALSPFASFQREGPLVPIQVDGEGNVYVLMEGVIYVVDPQGRAAGQISTEEYRREGDYEENLLRCRDGKVYYAAEGERGVTTGMRGRSSAAAAVTPFGNWKGSGWIPWPT